MSNGFKEVYEYRDMIISLVKRDLRGRYLGSVLGFLWSFVNPLGQIIIYTVVFSFIFRTGLENYYMYMIAGLIPWLFFSGAIQEGTGAIRAQSDMIKKIYFPRAVIPISVTTSNFVNMLFCFIVVFAVLIVTRYGANPMALLFLPIVMIIEYFLTLGVVLIVSAVQVYFRDLQQIIGLVLMAWIYLTPIMYTIDYIPESVRRIYIYINPMTPVIEAYHDILYWKRIPSGNLLVSAVAAVIVLIIGIMVFKKLEANFAEEM